MRRPLLAIACLSLGAFAPLGWACSSNNAAVAHDDAGTDTGPGSSAVLGAACNPALFNACASAAPPCFKNVCDPVQRICVEVQASCPGQGDAASILGKDAEPDAKPPPAVAPGCRFDSDCPTQPDGSAPLRCGYPVIDGCTATGTCVVPEIPVTANGEPWMACGCQSQPVPYITQTLTNAPAASALPCTPDAGPDASVDSGAGDAGGSDAASVDANADAAG
jgi:hypothetical protein